MAYTIKYSDGLKPSITVYDGEVNTITDLGILGKNYSRYGEVIGENFLHLLENFSSATAPARPVGGQLWFDQTNKIMKYLDDSVANAGNWKELANMVIAASAPSGVGESDGHFWINDTTGVISVYLNSGWIQIGATGGTRVETRVRLDTVDAPHNTLETIVNNVVVTIVSQDAATWTPKASELDDDGATLLSVGFSSIIQGVNLTSTGGGYYFNGTATTALLADLAERYKADVPMISGTVVELGGTQEITATTTDMSPNVFGIISTAPGLMLNSGAGTDSTHPYVALAGRVPCNVIGTVKKGDRLVTSSFKGVARALGAAEDHTYAHVIGRALVDKINNEIGLIEVVVGVK